MNILYLIREYPSDQLPTKENVLICGAARDPHVAQQVLEAVKLKARLHDRGIRIAVAKQVEELKTNALRRSLPFDEEEARERLLAGKDLWELSKSFDIMQVNVENIYPTLE